MDIETIKEFKQLSIELNDLIEFLIKEIKWNIVSKPLDKKINFFLLNSRNKIKDIRENFNHSLSYRDRIWTD